MRSHAKLIMGKQFYCYGLRDVPVAVVRGPNHYKLHLDPYPAFKLQNIFFIPNVLSRV